MPTVTIKFKFSAENETNEQESDFDIDNDITDDVEEAAQEMLDGLNEDQGGEGENTEWTYDGYEVIAVEFDECDWEPSDFGGDLDKMIDLAYWIDRASNPEAVEIFAKEQGIDYAKEADESYQGRFDDWTNFARSIADDLYNIPSNIANYFDYEALGRDLQHDYDGFEHKGELYVFRS